MSSEQTYNRGITIAVLDRQERFDPCKLELLTYSSPRDTCLVFPSGKLCNMAGGFHFDLLGAQWYRTEHLYLCGEWSTAGDKSIEIQSYVRKMKSGAYAKRFAKAKYKSEIRPDFATFRLQWMLWCVWQKCLLCEDYANLLMSVPEDVIIVEVVKGDPIWATYPDDNGILVGNNAMGKILTICRRCLIDGTFPAIDTELLNCSEIHILGNRVKF